MDAPTARYSESSPTAMGFSERTEGVVQRAVSADLHVHPKLLEVEVRNLDTLKIWLLESG